MAPAPRTHYGGKARAQPPLPGAKPGTLDDSAEQILTLFEERVQGVMALRLRLQGLVDACAAQEEAFATDLKTMLALRHREHASWQVERQELMHTITHLRAELRLRERTAAAPRRSAH